MSMIPVTKEVTRHALVIPLKNLPNYRENYIGMVANNTNLSRVEIFQAAVQIADGLCSEMIEFKSVMEFLRRMHLTKKETHYDWPDPYEYILSLGQTIRMWCPTNTVEVIYQRTTHGQLFLSIGVLK